MFLEDSLAIKTLEVIGYTHNLQLESYKQHVRMDRLEIDLYAYFTTVSGVERTVLIELKDSDFPRLYKQLVNRRYLANYVYGSINIPAYVIFQVKRYRQLFHDLLEMGVGLITWQHYPQVILKARFNRYGLSSLVVDNEERL